MLRIILYIVACAAGAYTALLYNSRAILLLSVCGTVLLPILLLQVWLVSRKLSVSIRAPFSVTEKGKTVTVQIRTEERASSCGLIEVWISFKNIATGKKKRKRIVLVEKSGKYKGSVEFVCKYSGTMQLRIERVRVYDCLGCFCITYRRWNKKGRAGERITVLPPYKELPVEICERTRNFAVESNFYDSRRGGDDPSETFQIREYLPGDKMQSIHWKMSARTDELYVKDHGKPICYPIVLLYEVPYKGQKEKPEQTEESLYVLASMAYSLLLQECPYIVSWYDAETENMLRVKVHDAEGFYGMLMELLSAGRLEKKYDWEQCYEDTYKGDICETCLVLPRTMEGLNRELERRNYLF